MTYENEESDGALVCGEWMKGGGRTAAVSVRSQPYKPSLAIGLTAVRRAGGAGVGLGLPLPALGSGGQPLCCVAVAVHRQRDQMHARCIRSCNNTQHAHKAIRPGRGAIHQGDR